MAKKATTEKQFRVTLDDNSPRPLSTIVTAKNEKEAEEKFKEWAGIIRTNHSIVVVDIATESAEEDSGSESQTASDGAPANSGMASSDI